MRLIRLLENLLDLSIFEVRAIRSIDPNDAFATEYFTQNSCMIAIILNSAVLAYDTKLQITYTIVKIEITELRILHKENIKLTTKK